MLILGSTLRVADNSGAKVAQCIKVLGGSKRKVARVGDTIVVSIKELRSTKGSKARSRVTKGSVHRAIVLRTKKECRRKDGTNLRFDENAIALLNAQELPMGTRIFGPILEDLRLAKDMKLISLASSLV
jgi:large subunit ribosomal protein L14